MASNAKKKTTMAKLNRENAVRERRLRKQARKDARKHAAAEPPVAVAEPPVALEEPLEGADEVAESSPSA